MLTYNNDPQFKAQVVAMAIKHRDSDMLRSGTYGYLNGGRFNGCSVGCDAFDICGLDNRKHSTTSKYFGFPIWLEYWRDRVFEGLPAPERYEFHVQLKEAIPVGADIEHLKYKITIKRLSFLQKLKPVLKNKRAFDSLQFVIDCCELKLSGAEPDWTAARKMAAYAYAYADADAAAAAAYAAYAAYAADAAAYAAYAADAAAAAAAYAYAADAAADADARTSFWRIERDWMLELLAEIKP